MCPHAHTRSSEAAQARACEVARGQVCGPGCRAPKKHFCTAARVCQAHMSTTSRTGRETGRKLDSGVQSALEKIKRQRAGGSGLDAVEIEIAKEAYDEVSDEEYERRQRRARREGFVEEDGGELCTNSFHNDSSFRMQKLEVTITANTSWARTVKVRLNHALLSGILLCD